VKYYCWLDVGCILLLIRLTSKCFTSVTFQVGFKNVLT